MQQAMNSPAQRKALAKALGMPPIAEIGTGIARRAVLAGGASTGLLIAVGGFVPTSAFAAAPGAAGAEGLATGPLAPNQFVRVGTDNLVTIVCKHHEMGQGNATGLASMAADELDADWALVRTEFAPSDAKLYANLAFGMPGTGGSSAVANSYLQMRSAGATARAMLVAAAAEAWKVPFGKVRASNSVLSHASGKRATYGEMAAAAQQKPPANPVLKTPAQFTLMGKADATPRVDSAEKCNGTAIDCGVAVNPDVIKAQMEGCIGFALGALYYGEIEVKNGRAAQRNFDTYKSLRIHEMPKVEVYIVPSTVAPTGVGEPGVPPLAPAVANAIAKLGGPKVRRLPFARAGIVQA